MAQLRDDAIRVGTRPRAVQDVLGHARIEITLGTYTASVPEMLREAADNLDRALAKAGERVPTGVGV